MALTPLYCAGCGLEIEPYEQLLTFRNGIYHGDLYPCYPDPHEKEDQ